MRTIQIALAAAIMAASFASIVEAKDKMAKAKPGKCGAGMYYNMKMKKCMAPVAKT